MTGFSDRLKSLIKEVGITQSLFAKRANISQPFISLLCSGAKIPSDRTIMDICRAFGVNELWLREGIGEMFRNTSHDEEIAAFFGDLTSCPDGFRKAFVSILSRMTPEEWMMVERKARELAKEIKETDPE